jgi:hypothetical protein
MVLKKNSLFSVNHKDSNLSPFYSKYTTLKFNNKYYGKTRSAALFNVFNLSKGLLYNAYNFS